MSRIAEVATLVVAATVAIAVAGRRTADRAWASASSFLLVLGAVIAVELALAKPVGGAHHVLLLWPVPYLLAAALMAAGGIARYVAVVFAAVTLAVHVGTAATYTRAFRDNGRWTPAWSPEVYRLAEHARADGHRVDRVVTVDWGVGQVFGLLDDGERARFYDLWGTFMTVNRGSGTDAAAVGRQWFAGRRVLALSHTDRSELVDGVNAAFRAVVASLPSGRAHIVFRGRDFVAWEVDG